MINEIREGIKSGEELIALSAEFCRERWEELMYNLSKRAMVSFEKNKELLRVRCD
ncbi:MAG: hypothetical protein KKA64_02760 [Nanoarchaeota archaeon]|nr:hypothetical protein [Nanoarchaeota archaeon]